MKPVIVDQPPPLASGRRPAWDLVIEHVEQRRSRSLSHFGDVLVDQVLVDMRARDTACRTYYGAPLGAGNDRDHLMDAYQSALDFSAYLAAELDEHGIALDEPISTERPDSWRLIRLQSMLWDHVRTIVQLRALIDERDTRGNAQ